MRKYLMIGCVGLFFLIGLAGCGNDTGFDAVVVAPGSVTVTGDLAGLDEVPLIGLQFLVQKNSSDKTPVPDAKIVMESGAAGGSVLMCLHPWVGFFPGPYTCDLPVGGATYMTMYTSETGAVLIYPKVIARSCVGTSGSIDGEGSVAGIISTNMGVSDITFTVSC